MLTHFNPSKVEYLMSHKPFFKKDTKHQFLHKKEIANPEKNFFVVPDRPQSCQRVADCLQKSSPPTSHSCQV